MLTVEGLALLEEDEVEDLGGSVVPERHGQEIFFVAHVESGSQIANFKKPISFESAFEDGEVD